MEEGAGTRTKMRVFVGGLGESVMDDDLRRIFGSLGSVQGVDVVRTKGRSFAYVDFCPSAHNSLSKLFSTYNGCVWKGGRLRLEIAREHYLVRLKREWAEEAEPASRGPAEGFDGDEDITSSNNPKKVSPEKRQLRIYFPSLRKVKSVPLSGTGKHKYSFQRVEVPPLPINFCDCEEHSSNYNTTKEKQTCDAELESVGVNEEEFNIMKLVMNKLFERGKVVSNAAHDGSGLIKERDCAASDNSEADSATDDDNLIINVTARRDNKMAFIGNQDKKRISGNQFELNVQLESRFKGMQTSKDEQIETAQKRNIISPNKKSKSLFKQESDHNRFLSAIPRGKDNLKNRSDGSVAEPESNIQQSATLVSWSQKSSWRQLVHDKGNTAFNVTHILPGDASSEEEKLKLDGSCVPDSTNSKDDNLVEHGDYLGSQSVETIKEDIVKSQPAKANVASSKSGAGASWLQKSSWTQLVGENRGSSFSIAQILPGSSYKNQVTTQTNRGGTICSTDSKLNDLRRNDDSNPAEIGKDKNVVRSTPEKNQWTVLVGNEAPGPVVGKRNDSATKLITAGNNIRIGETCSFMRSETSLKEWAKTKAALSGSLKRKGSEK